MFGLETGIFILLFIAILAACFFEFINGFHDTANAVATVIYTKSLKAPEAVIWSAIVNFLGVITGGVGVGLSIINLLPIELLINENVYQSIAMIMSVLLSAIIWNFGTWYFGIPSSSSHTLIGAILGVGLGFVLLPGQHADLSVINWDKAKSVFTGLLLAPIIGFTLAIFLMYMLKKLVKKDLQEEIFSEPKKDSKPAFWIRAILISTSTLVSFFHGRNDGQKGIGLMMLILIAILPSYFAVISNDALSEIKPQINQIAAIANKIDSTNLSVQEKAALLDIKEDIAFIEPAMANPATDTTHRLLVRGAILKISSSSKTLLKSKSINLSTSDKATLTNLATKEESGIRSVVDYAPYWVILMISLSLGFGTMIGWKRIVITIGEKIGKTHLSYGQGASAELVAAATIGLASGFGLPVSTTHTLSSGIAGTMVAENGLKNLQFDTIKNIVITWVLTLPVSVILSASLFIIFRLLIS